MLLNCGAGELLRVPWIARRSNQSILKEISPGCSLEGLMLKRNSNTLAISCEELTHWKRHWCWERLRAGGEGDDRRWNGWMASSTWWTWVWVDSGSWWWTGRPGALWFMESQRVGHDWATELNWKCNISVCQDTKWRTVNQPGVRVVYVLFFVNVIWLLWRQTFQSFL